MLLHLYLDLLRLLLELIENFRESLVVGLLFLLLLALGAIWHRYLAIVIDLLLQVFGHCAHLFLLIVNVLSQVIVVSISANLFFQLN